MADDKPMTIGKSKRAGKTGKRATTTAGLSLKQTAKIASLSVGDLSKMISAEVNKAIGNVGGARPGVHVNSGPPGFVNGGGHANFDPRVAGGSHVNSGPPGFVNGGGHANFDPKVKTGFQQVSLPDGSIVQIPATGPVNLIVRGFKITR